MERDIERVYRTVNEAWGRPRAELPALTYPEAKAAVRALCRVAGVPLKPAIKMKETSGNRYTWVRSMVYYINPGNGWWHLVHDVSHRCHRRLHRGARPHDPKEAYLERRLIEHVVASGWLDGKLKRPVRQKPKADVKAVRHARVLARIKKWEAKRKRAETALKTLRRQKSYYEKNGAPSMDSNPHPSQYKSAALPIGAIGA